jgi:predicted XRE-type DNA-binding protein
MIWKARKRYQTRDIADRFWEKVDVRASNECWEWRASISGRYGQFRVDGKYLRSHRVAYTLHKGTIPDGMVVCHKCDYPLCCNPDHLFLGTLKDNSQDMVSKGRLREQRGEKNAVHCLTDQQVEKIRKLYELDVMTQRQIAALFGTTRSNIGLIVHGKTWKHVA